MRVIRERFIFLEPPFTSAELLSDGASYGLAYKSCKRVFHLRFPLLPPAQKNCCLGCGRLPSECQDTTPHKELSCNLPSSRHWPKNRYITYAAKFAHPRHRQRGYILYASKSLPLISPHPLTLFISVLPNLSLPFLSRD